MTSARDLISRGDFEEGLDSLWVEVDSGNGAARIELANLFTDNQLHAFAQDQWGYLVENSAELSGIAKLGIGANRLWLRDYERASLAIVGVDGSEGLQQAINSAKSSDPLLDPTTLTQFAGEVLLDEANLLAELEGLFSLEAQSNLIQARDVIANISTIISYPGNKPLKSLQFQSVVANNLSVPGVIGDHFGEPKDALVRTAHACGLMIHSLSQNETQVESELFKSACKIGLASFEKIFLLSEEIYSPKDPLEAEAFQVITWGLNQLGMFAGFIYGGLLAD
jgi:hypothetical protein